MVKKVVGTGVCVLVPGTGGDVGVEQVETKSEKSILKKASRLGDDGGHPPRGLGFKIVF